MPLRVLCSLEVNLKMSEAVINMIVCRNSLDFRTHEVLQECH